MLGRIRSVAPALAALSLVLGAGGCVNGEPIGTENWTCDWDSSVARPVGDPGTSVNDAGLLPPSACATACGPPVSVCSLTTLDGGQPGAICPFCTF